MARLLCSLPEVGDLDRPAPTLDGVAAVAPGAVVTAPTSWGPLRRLAGPGVVGGTRPRLGPAGPLGAGPASWELSAAGR